MNEASDGSNVLPATPPILPRTAVQRWRLVLARAAIADAVQRDQLLAWEVALASSGLPCAGLDAAKPRPRFASAAPLVAAIPGEAELLDLWLVERQPAWRVREALIACMPPGWRLVDLYDVWLGEAALPGRVVASVYRATIAPGTVGAEGLREAASALIAAMALPRDRSKGETVVAYDLRPFIAALEVDDGDAGPVVTMTLRHDPEKGVGRPEELLAALGERAGAALTVASLVRERLELGDPSPPPPPAPRRRPAGRAADAPPRAPGGHASGGALTR